MKNEFVFKESNGALVYVGDFEGLYQNETDPWGQSATADTPMDHYYKHSRQTLATLIQGIAPAGEFKVLEVGCGHGHSTQDLATRLPRAQITGMDISHTAVEGAQKLFPTMAFVQGDIRAAQTQHLKAFDLVVLHQMLWYVLDDIEAVVANTHHLLRDHDAAACIITQAFPREQRFGKAVMDGFEGAVKCFKAMPGVRLSQALYSDWEHLPHMDCHFLVQFR